MSPEIRINLKPSRRRLSTLELVVTIVGVLIYLAYNVFTNPDKSNSYSLEFQQLKDSQQLLMSERPVTESNFEKVQVESITDGDTIKIKRSDNSAQNVRYIGINTPEIKHQGNGENQPYGVEATEMNRYLVEGKTVYLQKDAADTDKYGRLLRYVYLEDGTMVNYALIRMGYAALMTIPPNVNFQQKFFEGQELARSEKLNLYSN